MTPTIENVYLPQLTDARARLAAFAQGPLLTPGLPPDKLLRFLIQFSALGVRMTEPVESWIRRAGERCLAVGMDKLGQALVKHARQERDHHLMMLEDTRRLVARWNRTHVEQLDVDTLLAHPGTPAMDAYVRLHEETIASTAPYAQVAIEFEIEHLSVALGPALIRQCRALLGDEILGELSFMVEHVEVDVAHTELNARLLDKLISVNPLTVGVLAQAGGRALGIYLDFLEDCFATANIDSVIACAP